MSRSAKSIEPSAAGLKGQARGASAGSPGAKPSSDSHSDANERAAAKPADIVDRALESYARRGVFRGYSRSSTRGVRTTYRLTWHHGRTFELVLDVNRQTLRFPSLLSNVPPGKDLYRPLAAFVRARQSEGLPPHRRINRDKALVKSYRRAGKMSLTLEVKDGDYEYGAQKLIHLVHEIFLDFLREGPGYEYVVENFDLDPDSVS